MKHTISRFNAMPLKSFFRSTLSIIIFFVSFNVSAQSYSSLYPDYQTRKVSPGKTTYYVDPQSGNDDNNGIYKKSPWKTFKRVNQLVLAAGDKLEILKAGAFHETLALMAEGKQNAPVKVKFAPGIYDFFPDQALKQPMHISNTNDSPGKPKAIALLFDNCRFTDIEGRNAIILLRGKMMETYVNNCTNIKLDGLSFDYYRPTVSELRVIGTGADYADIQMHRDSKFSIKDSVLTWQGEGWSHHPDNLWQKLNLATNDLSRVDIPMKDVRFVAMGKNNVRAYFKKELGFKKGFIYQNRDIERDYAAFFIQRSKNVELTNIRIYFMHGMGIVSQLCENVKIDRVVVKPAERSGRTCAAWADILHFSGCKGLINVGNSYLSAANDDAINVHGVHLKIVKIENQNQIRVKFMHGQTYGFNPFSVGDSLDFIHAASLLSIGNNLISETKMINEKEILLTLKNSVSKDVRVNDVIENITATPEVWIHHNVITRIPTRGILTTTRRKILIEYNDIMYTHMSGILVSDDAESWYESGMVKNLVISHNNFVKCGGPVIAIHPENTQVNTTPVHRNISVLNNTFNLLGPKVFFAKSTADIKIKGNTIRMQKPVKKIEELIELENCTPVNTSKNKIKSR